MLEWILGRCRGEGKAEEWTAELDGVKAFFDRFGPAFPKELWKQSDNLKERLTAKIPA